MAECVGKVQILVVQFWIRDVAPIRAALTAAGMDVAITRVDIEPALYAALTWDRYDLVLYDSETTTISRAAVEEALRATRRDLPLVVIDQLDTLGERARLALLARSC
jgi:hypothetical protein